MKINFCNNSLIDLLLSTFDQAQSYKILSSENKKAKE